MAVLGGTVALSVLTMSVAVLVWWRTKQARNLILPLLAVTGSWVLAEVVGLAVGRQPPPVADMLATTPRLAFPSAHATQAAACLLTVAFLAWGVLPSWRSRVVTVSAALSGALLVGMSRLTLAVHWLTDVLGGWALGTLWFAVVVVVNEVAGSLRRWDATGAPGEPVTQQTG